MKIYKNVPLPSVKIGIVRQNYKKELSFKCQERATSRSFNPLAWKIPTSYCQKGSLFLILLHYRHSQLISPPNQTHLYGLSPQNKCWMTLV